MVHYYTIPIYLCICDNCGKSKRIEKDYGDKIYNGAQAVRSLGWSFGHDGKVKCSNCRVKRNKKVVP